jgi:PKD repeat protein
LNKNRFTRRLAIVVGLSVGFAAVYIARNPAPQAEPLAALVKDARSRLLANQRPVSAATVQPDVTARPVAIDLPHFAKVVEGTYEARERRFDATVSAGDGLCYRPKINGSPELHLKLERVTIGQTELYSSNQSAEQRVENDAQSAELVLPHAGFEERYFPRRDGIEQRFVFNTRPAGRGALEFSCALECQRLAPVAARVQRAGGIQFTQPDGSFAARYGQVSVTDAARHVINIEPALSVDGRSVGFSIPETWLREAVFPVVVDPLVGGDFVVSPDNPTGVGAPTVAAGVNNYLVVWDDFALGANAPQLLASIVTQTAVVSNPIILTPTTAAPLPYRFQRIESAFDGISWLVVWAQDTATGSSIHGAIISSGASATATTNTIPPVGTVLGGTDFNIAGTTGTVQEDPLVTFNGTDYLVAWTTGPAVGQSGSQIFYVRVTTGGQVSTPQIVPARTNPPNQAIFFLSGNNPSGDTLMLYRENAETPLQTRSTRIASDGTLRDPGGTSVFVEDPSLGGFGRPIGAAFINQEWQILSTYDQTTNSSVFLHHLSTTGTVTPPTGVFAVMGLGPTGTTADNFAPAFAGTSSWLFLREEKVKSTVYHILGKRVGFDGTDMDPIPFQIDTATQGILRNGVAAQAGSLFLVSWLDGRKGTTQPADSLNIAAALVDASVADTTAGPALTAAITASPVSGPSPLNVSFDSSGSTGSFDTLTWNFGDGTSSTSSAVAHTYTKDGVYLAQLSLAKGSYVVSQTQVITVGSQNVTGGGAGTPVGVPIASSDNLVPSLFISGALITMDFTSATNDVARITGIIDLGVLPTSLTGVTGSVNIGSQKYQFTLDAKGSFTSDASQRPFVQFAVNPASGAFAFQLTKEDLQANLAAFGAANATISPAIFVQVPISVSVSTFSATSTVGLQYTAKQGATGTGTYIFLKKGETVTGSFIITKFSASQQGLGNSATHSYTISGELVRPNGAKYKPALTGQFVFQVGNYQLSLPVGQFVGDSKGNLKFVSRAGSSGLKKFSIQANSGKFTLQLINVPATGTGGSSLPLDSGNDITAVDLNLSFQFNLDDGELDAGRYIFISRKSSTTKKWGLR